MRFSFSQSSFSTGSASRLSLFITGRRHNEPVIGAANVGFRPIADISALTTISCKAHDIHRLEAKLLPLGRLGVCHETGGPGWRVRTGVCAAGHGSSIVIEPT